MSLTMYKYWRVEKKHVGEFVLWFRSKCINILRKFIILDTPESLIVILQSIINLLISFIRKIVAVKKDYYKWNHDITSRPN